MFNLSLTSYFIYNNSFKPENSIVILKKFVKWNDLSELHMENVSKKEFQHSLDLPNAELEQYIPDLLKGLWELGSMPEYVVEIIRRNNIGVGENVIDLGCGKGAVLVTLAQQFEIKGLGVDIVPHFIEEAIKYAKEFGVSNKVVFKTQDIVEVVNSISKQDIVIYGYDSEVLGDLKSTLEILTNCIKDDGFIILEFMVSKTISKNGITEIKMIDIIHKSNYQILDRIEWDIEKLKRTNEKNTAIITENVNKLKSKFPDKVDIFKEYLQNQLNECFEIENEHSCLTLLLTKN